MHLSHGQLGPRIGDPGLGVGVVGSRHALRQRGEVERRIHETRPVTGHQRERLHVQRGIGVVRRPSRGHHDGRCRTVGHTGAVEH